MGRGRARRWREDVEKLGRRPGSLSIFIFLVSRPSEANPRLTKQLTISYLDPLTSPKTRQETLQKIYSFTCTCAICEPSSISSSPPALPQIPSNPPLPHRSTGPVPYPSVSYPGESSNVTRIPEKDIANLTRRFEDAHCEARWDEAARLGETVLTVYWLGYGPFWPLIGSSPCLFFTLFPPFRSDQHLLLN